MFLLFEPGGTIRTGWRVSNFSALISLYALLTAFYVLPARMAPGFATLVIITACFFAYDDFRREIASLGRSPLRFLFALIMLVAGHAILIWGMGRSTLGEMQERLGSSFLLAAFILFMRICLARLSRRSIFLAIFLCAFAGAVLSISLNFQSIMHGFRLEWVGRSTNSIPGGILAAVGMISGICFLVERREFHEDPAGSVGAFFSQYATAIVAAGLIVMGFALIASGSRGAVLSLVLAAALGFLVQDGSRYRLLGGCIVIFATLVSSIFVEPLAKTVNCFGIEALCRDSLRSTIWQKFSSLMMEAPWVGHGAHFRLPLINMEHPHNGLLGSAVFYGVPLTVVFVGAFSLATLRVTSLSKADRLFVAMALGVSFGNFATNFSDPFLYFREHYLSFWLPMLMLAL